MGTGVFPEGDGSDFWERKVVAIKCRRRRFPNAVKIEVTEFGKGTGEKDHFRIEQLGDPSGGVSVIDADFREMFESRLIIGAARRDEFCPEFLAAVHAHGHDSAKALDPVPRSVRPGHVPGTDFSCLFVLPSEQRAIGDDGGGDSRSHIDANEMRRTRVGAEPIFSERKCSGVVFDMQRTSPKVQLREEIDIFPVGDVGVFEPDPIFLPDLTRDSDPDPEHRDGFEGLG